MTQAEKIANVQTRVGNVSEATPELIAVYLDDAKDAILKQRYPFGVPSDVRCDRNTHKVRGHTMQTRHKVLPSSRH